MPFKLYLRTVFPGLIPTKTVFQRHFRLHKRWGPTQYLVHMSRHAVQLTPEQLAKQEARRLKKLEKVQLNKTTHTLLSQAEDERADILVRPWNITGAESHLSGCQRTTVKTWNVRTPQSL